MTLVTGHARHAWVNENLFIEAAAHRLPPDILALTRTWHPDLIVRESSEFSGCVAAEALGMPHASVATASDAALDCATSPPDLWTCAPLGRLPSDPTP